MCPTRTRLALQRAVDAVDGKVVDVGDHRQIPSVDVGGGHYALARRLGATVLGHGHRFRDPAELFRDHQPAAPPPRSKSSARRAPRPTITRSRPTRGWRWSTTGSPTATPATKCSCSPRSAPRSASSTGWPAPTSLPARRSRTYQAPDDRSAITLAVGDEIVLRRNHRLTQRDGTTLAVRNGMTGRVIVIRRREITVELDGAHRSPERSARVTLPAGYVGTHVDHGYARTVDTAQGAAVDHSLFAPSASATAERAYVALSRGRHSNRLYATRDRAWIDAIGQRRGRSAFCVEFAGLARWSQPRPLSAVLILRYR